MADNKVNAKYVVDYFKRAEKTLNKKGWGVLTKRNKSIATITLDNQNIKKTLLFDTNTVPYSKDALHCTTKTQFFDQIINIIQYKLCIEDFFEPNSYVMQYKKLIEKPQKVKTDKYSTQSINNVINDHKYKLAEHGWSVEKKYSKGRLKATFSKGTISKTFVFNTGNFVFDANVLHCHNKKQFFQHFCNIVVLELGINDFFTPQSYITREGITPKPKAVKIEYTLPPERNDYLFYQSYQVDDNDNIIGEINERPEEVVIEYTPPPEKKYTPQPNYFQFM